jgi:hypothetical protein
MERNDSILAQGLLVLTRQSPNLAQVHPPMREKWL